MGQERFDLGTEEQSIVHDPIIQRFDPEIIPRSVQRMLLFIVDNKRKHTPKMRSRLPSKDLVGLQNDFGIRIRTEDAAVLLDQFLPDLPVIIDFSIKNDNMAAIRTVDGLGAAFQVDNT